MRGMFAKSFIYTVQQEMMLNKNWIYLAHTLICEHVVCAEYSYKVCTVVFIPKRKPASIYYFG